MWDLLFGKPKKRYYKPKKKLVSKPNEAVGKNVNFSKRSKTPITHKPKKIIAETPDIFEKDIEINVVDTTDSTIKNVIIKDKLQQKTVVDIKIYNNLVQNLKQEMNTVFLSAFLAKTDDSLVIKSWFMDDGQSQKLSEIYVNTDLFLFNQSHAKIKSYYILDLDEHKLLFALKLDSYQFTMVLNSNETSVGYLISIVKPIIEEHIKNN